MREQTHKPFSKITVPYFLFEERRRAPGLGQLSHAYDRVPHAFGANFTRGLDILLSPISLFSGDNRLKCSGSEREREEAAKTREGGGEGGGEFLINLFLLRCV